MTLYTFIHREPGFKLGVVSVENTPNFKETVITNKLSLAATDGINTGRILRLAIVGSLVEV
jgi:hypothetical protein